MAANLLACQKESGNTVLCIQDWDSRRGVRFTSSVNTNTVSGSSRGEVDPLQVVLDDGTTCSTTSHDQTPHYAARSSWLYCGDEGALLLPKDSDSDTMASYFDKSTPHWTAQYSPNVSTAPRTVGVKDVFYAK